MGYRDRKKVNLDGIFDELLPTPTAKRKPLVCSLNLDGIFEESIPTAKRKPRIYGSNQYLSRFKTTVLIEESGLDTVVLKPKRKLAPRSEYKKRRRADLVSTREVIPESKSRPDEGSELKDRPAPRQIVEKQSREDQAYKPSPEEIKRAADVITEIRRCRLKATLDTREG